MKIFEKHGFAIKELFLLHCYLDNCASFGEIMKHLPNVERFTIINLQLRDKHIPFEVDLPEVANLKTLNLIECPLKILNCFNGSRIESLKVVSPKYIDSNPSSDPKPLTDFLRTQENLKTISLGRIKLSANCRLFSTDKLNESLPFHLTKLTIQNFDLGPSADHYNNGLQFIKLHAHSIKELDIGDRFPGSVYTYVLTKLKKLQSLHIDIDSLSIDTIFDTNLKVTNVTLRNITTNFHNVVTGCPKALLKFARHFKNVTSLKLNGQFDEQTMAILAKKLKHLTKLYVTTLRGEALKGVQFAELQSLSISKIIGHGVDWNRFTKDNSHITELIINTDISSKKLDSIDILNITINLNLQTLSIGFNFNPDVRFFETIRQNCPELKVLTLDYRCAYASGSNCIVNFPGLRFVNKKSDGLFTPFFHEPDEDESEVEDGSPYNDLETNDEE